MAFSQSDKEYLDLKIDPIVDHLKKLNGRVGKAEETIDEALIERASNREHQKQVEHKLNDFCGKVNNQQEKGVLYNFALKYPVIFVVGVMGVSVIGSTGLVSLILNIAGVI